MAGSSTIGKGDTSRPGVRGDKKGGGYGVFTEKTYSNVGAKRDNLAGNLSIAAAPKTTSGKTALEKPPAKLPAPTGVATVTPVFKMPAAKTKKVVAKPAAKVISNVTREKLSPTKAAPTRMAVNPRTGDTTGFTTGTTTGSSASKPGVAGKTYQSAYGRMMSNAERRFGVAGPTGGGSSRSNSGGSSRSTSGGGSSRSTSGGGNLGGAAGRIGEERGSKK